MQHIWCILRISASLTQGHFIVMTNNKNETFMPNVTKNTYDGCSILGAIIAPLS